MSHPSPSFGPRSAGRTSPVALALGVLFAGALLAVGLVVWVMRNDDSGSGAFSTCKPAVEAQLGAQDTPEFPIGDVVADDGEDGVTRVEGTVIADGVPFTWTCLVEDGEVTSVTVDTD